MDGEWGTGLPKSLIIFLPFLSLGWTSSRPSIGSERLAILIVTVCLNFLGSIGKIGFVFRISLFGN